MHRPTTSQPLSTSQLVHPELSSPPTSPGAVTGAPKLLEFPHTVPSPVVNVIIKLESPVSHFRSALKIPKILSLAHRICTHGSISAIPEPPPKPPISNLRFKPPSQISPPSSPFSLHLPLFLSPSATFDFRFSLPSGALHTCAVRRGVYRAWASLSGTPLPHPPPSSTTAVMPLFTWVGFAFTV
ncbi:hypothetical protein BV25DRAFT_1922876 [Artomyces pyxidatus]|uniref:Uncharacterized protein n=1 Tax=Artomyces pyxidatus TaxID=48021 RepID=A0ACB8SDK4_9AGAM|nr:hypothetical protein BV25DRAFT_1922876 [Artomyces pyxidatus]